MRRALERLAADVCRGLLAGAVGTAAMTVSTSIESRLRNRAPSSAPAEAAGKVLGVEPTDDAGKARFSTIAHWGYGTSWGAARGAYAYLGLPAPQATAAHFGTVWAAALVMLPTLGVAPPPWRWGGAEVAIDALHHAVYATATSGAYAAIDR